MKKLLLILLLLSSTVSYAEEMSVTEKQFQNIDEIDKAMRKRYTSYQGVNGSAKKLDFRGITKEQAKEVLDSVDLDVSIKKRDEKFAVKKSAITKLKNIGLTDDELIALRLEESK